MKSTIIIAIIAVIILVGAVGAYIFLSQPSNSNPNATIALNGAGATFPQPFLNSTIQSYHSIKSNVNINYQGGGSGAGINALTQKTVDFAASDAPLTDSQRSAAPNVLHIPETIGAVTLAYNLPGVSNLKLSGDVIAKIYLGTISNWNEPAIAAINTGVTLPDHAISTVHRSDSSGTTNVFTKYLKLISADWNSQIGAGTSVQWPGGLGASGNSNVASTITQTQYSIGYVELAYALQNNMPVASIQNSEGNYVAPRLNSISTAVQSGAQGLPSGEESWTGVSLLNTSGQDAYPIVSFTYLLEYKELNVIPGMTQEKATALVQYIWYVIHDGQQLASSLQYAPLPANVVQINEATIRSITFNGQTLPVT